MGQVSFVDVAGEERKIDVADGLSLMEAAIRSDVPGIEGECGGACACATCHVYVDAAWLDLTGMADGAEKDMLEFAQDVRENSRLSCQIVMRPELDGLIVTTPVSQGY